MITHAVAGAAIGHAVSSPWVAFWLGAASHFLMDLFPHGDAYLLDHYKKGKSLNMGAVYLIVDMTLTSAFIWFVASTRLGVGGWAVAGIVGSLIPDFMVWLAEMTKIPLLMRYYEFHEWVHGLFSMRIRDFTLPVGIAVQLAILGIMFIAV